MKNTVAKGTDFYMNGKLIGKVVEVRDVTPPDGFPTFNISVEGYANQGDVWDTPEGKAIMDELEIEKA